MRKTIEQIKKLVEKKRIRQAELAEACQVSESTISEWIRDASKVRGEAINRAIRAENVLSFDARYEISCAAIDDFFLMPDDVWEELDIDGNGRIDNEDLNLVHMDAAVDMANHTRRSHQQTVVGGRLNAEQGAEHISFATRMRRFITKAMGIVHHITDTNRKQARR